MQNFLKAQNFNSLIGLSHDWLLYAFARKKAFHWYFDSNSYIFYRQHLSNVYGDAGLWGNLIKKYNLIGSKWYRVQVKRILELIGVDDIPDSILSWANSGPYYKRIGIIKHVFALRRRRGESILLTLFILLGIA